MSTELEIKTVTDGLKEYNKTFDKLSRKKITFNKTDFVKDMQNLYEQTLSKWQTVWNEMGLRDFNDIGRSVAISCGELSAMFCCNNLGVSRVSTESLILLYSTLQYYLEARKASELGAAEGIQRVFMKDMRFCGITNTELEEIYNLIVYSDYCKYFEIYDIEGFNVCDHLLKLLGDSKKNSITPDLYITNNGEVHSNSNAILVDSRFLWYYAPENMDVYVYMPINYCFQQMLKISRKVLDKLNVSEMAVNDALLYLGIPSEIIGRYASTACSGVPQYYNGLLRDVIMAQSRKSNNFYQLFYIDKLMPRVKAYMGAIIKHLSVVPGTKVFGLTDKYLAFAVPKGTDLSNVLADEIQADMCLAHRITDVNAYYEYLLNLN